MSFAKNFIGVFAVTQCLAVPQLSAQTIPPAPEKDAATPYYDRHKIDVSNLRDFYEGLLIGDVMTHAEAMFSSETKWRLTLYQMILSGSRHHQARAALQLEFMGVPLDEIQAMYADDFVETVQDPRLKAAFVHVGEASLSPASVTADSHAALRTHYTDRQIVELFDLVSFNSGMARHDLMLPIPTDQSTIDWATENLGPVGWTVGLNAAAAPDEQRAAPFVGEPLAQAFAEIDGSWNRADLMAPGPMFKTDFVNMMTGYQISPVTFDGDLDGVEFPFDGNPMSSKQWFAPGQREANMPPESTPPFDVAAYDYPFYTPATVPETKYPLSDRNNLDFMLNRQVALGGVAIDNYFSTKDRTLTLEQKWEMFFVTQLAGGCVHCQVHGAYGIYEAVKHDYRDKKLPQDKYPELLARIEGLFDFERSDLFTDAEKAAYRLARDAGPVPSRVTAAHIEELRRHYSDREIQEMISLLITTGWLSTAMQQQLTVTDRISMAFALRHLTPMGWTPGVHLGAPNEQRRFHMSEMTELVVGKILGGEVADLSSEWMGIPVPLAIDADGDGVEDAFDGFPDDPTKWADTDMDGIEDARDADIDGDGISNEAELANGTFPYKADSDGDGLIDPVEIEKGSDPLDPMSL